MSTPTIQYADALRFWNRTTPHVHKAGETCSCGGTCDPCKQKAGLSKLDALKAKLGIGGKRAPKAAALDKGAHGKFKSKRAQVGGICSQAMSDWKTSGMTSHIAGILGKCRAMAGHARRSSAAAERGDHALAAVLAGRVKRGLSGGPASAKQRITIAAELRAKRAGKQGALVQHSTPATQRPTLRQQADAAKLAKGPTSLRAREALLRLKKGHDSAKRGAKRQLDKGSASGAAPKVDRAAVLASRMEKFSEKHFGPSKPKPKDVIDVTPKSPKASAATSSKRPAADRSSAAARLLKRLKERSGNLSHDKISASVDRLGKRLSKDELNKAVGPTLAGRSKSETIERLKKRFADLKETHDKARYIRDNAEHGRAPKRRASR